MRSKRTMIVATIAAVLLGTRIECSMSQTASEHAPDEKVLSEYCGTYRWEPGGFLYLSYGTSSPVRISSLRSMSPARFERCIRPIATASSPVLAPRYRLRLSHESIFNATAAAGFAP